MDLLQLLIFAQWEYLWARLQTTSLIQTVDLDSGHLFSLQDSSLALHMLITANLIHTLLIRQSPLLSQISQHLKTMSVVC